MKRAVRAQGRTAITASKREGPLSRSNRRDSEGPLTPGKDLKALESDGQTLAALGAACIQHGMPPRVFMRTRKPWVRARRVFDGW